MLRVFPPSFSGFIVSLALILPKEVYSFTCSNGRLHLYNYSSITTNEYQLQQYYFKFTHILQLLFGETSSDEVINFLQFPINVRFEVFKENEVHVGMVSLGPALLHHSVEMSKHHCNIPILTPLHYSYIDS